MKEIDRRVGHGRLYAIHRGVYAVGRPELPPQGWWMAAVLACAGAAVLSHTSAAVLWGIRRPRGTATSGAHLRPPSLIDVSFPETSKCRRRGIRTHRCTDLPRADRTLRDRIPVTTPARTLIDLATQIDDESLETAVNQADNLGLIDPEKLRRIIDERSGMRGVSALRRILDRRTFALTDSELERSFLRLVRHAGLPRPLTQQRVNGFRVDFFWPDLGLVVETDGLRYHRTATQQSRDRLRDQAHLAAGLTPLRFTHAQIRYEAARVAQTLTEVGARLSPDPIGPGARQWPRRSRGGRAAPRRRRAG